MANISPDTPADHSEYGIKWPWSSYACTPQVDERFPHDIYKEKMALVAKIAKHCEQPRKDGRNRAGKFTGWQHGYFYSLPLAELRSIAPFPSMARSLAKRVRNFSTLLIRGSISEQPAGEARGKPPFQLFEKLLEDVLWSVRKRDSKVCVVDNNSGPIDYVRIVPFDASALDEAAFKSLFRVAAPFFSGSFEKYLLEGIGILRAMGDQPWNMLTLSCDIRRFFARGAIGFKPLYVAGKRTGHEMKYFATFSVHWLLKNNTDRNARAVPGADALSDMLSRDAEMEEAWAANPDCRKLEGRIVRVAFDRKWHAQMMLSMLALRWAVSAIWHLAGASGLSSKDLDQDEDKPCLLETA